MGRLSTIDLLVLTSSCQLLLILKVIPLFTKETALTRRSNVLKLSPSVSVPCKGTTGSFIALLLHDA
jgi:hypothetical protein